MRDTREVFVHLHLFKNAGTSFDAILLRHFGSAWASFDHRVPSASLTGPELLAILDEQPALKAVSSHQIRPPLPSSDEVHLVPIVFLRHPLDRVRSVYGFDRARGPVTPAAEIASCHDLTGYVDAMLELDHDVTCNFQARSLSLLRDSDTGERADHTDEEHGQSAEAFLETLAVVGVVEHFDRSLELLSPHLRRGAPDFAPGSERHNVTAGDLDLDSRLARLHDDLGPDRFARLAAANAVDLELHARSVARLGRTEGAPA